MCDPNQQQQMIIPRRAPYQSEIDFFNRSKVPGYASPDNHVVLSPSPAPGINPDAVAQNEAMRVYLRKKKYSADDLPYLSDDQKRFLDSTSYKSASDLDRRSTAISRLFSGDPTAGSPTLDQSIFLDGTRGKFRLK